MKRDDLRAFLAEKPYDAMVLTSEISRRYATGFHSTAGAVYLSAKQAVFFTDFRYAEAARAAISDFEVREIKAGQSYSSLINGLIEEDGAKKVALEDKTLTYAEFMSWSTALHATAVRLEDGVESLRMMKEDTEVEKIVAAQRIAEQALEEVLNDIRIGVTEKEIAARLTYLMLHYGAENMSFDPIVVSGANSSKPHGVPTEKTIEAGDFVTMDFGCIYDGYCSDMTRTFFWGEPDEETARIYDIVRRANEAAEALIAPGVRMCDLDRVARDVIEDAGYGKYFTHRLGHSIGLQDHEPGDVSLVNEKVVEPGMTFSIEPGIYLPGRTGVRIEDLALVTENGVEILNAYPHDPVRLG